jgi:hypothetical protein
LVENASEKAILRPFEANTTKGRMMKNSVLLC